MNPALARKGGVNNREEDKGMVMVAKKPLFEARRIVVKLGTSILTSGESQLDKLQVKKLVAQVSTLVGRKLEVVLVSSGAIGAGMGLLGLSKRPTLLPHQQAAAAIGQPQLMKLYDQFFRAQGCMTAQVLLTREDLNDRKRYLNAKNTLLALLECGVVPIINENDTVAVEEIKFGDNDLLSALVTNLVEGDLLIILSDVDGLYEMQPRTTKGSGFSRTLRVSGQKSKVKDQKLISTVKKITPAVEKLAAGTSKPASIGGMITKVQAAKIVTGSGVPCIIANGRTKNILVKIIDQQPMGTTFLPNEDKMAAKKRWIAFTSKLHGELIVDKGAKEALTFRGKSLLSSGILKVEGDFNIGETISIRDEEGQEFARGITNYTSAELERIKRLKTSQIEPTLGYKYYDEVVHRDNLVIL